LALASFIPFPTLSSHYTIYNEDINNHGLLHPGQLLFLSYRLGQEKLIYKVRKCSEELIETSVIFARAASKGHSLNTTAG
jgi:hypothetical protein